MKYKRYTHQNFSDVNFCGEWGQRTDTPRPICCTVIMPKSSLQLQCRQLLPNTKISSGNNMFIPRFINLKFAQTTCIERKQYIVPISNISENTILTKCYDYGELEKNISRIICEKKKFSPTTGALLNF